MRRLVAETRLGVDDLVAPLFVREDTDTPVPIPSLPGVVQHSRGSLRAEVRELAELGVPAVILFGVPATKDAEGSGASDPDGRHLVILAREPTCASPSTPTTATAACSPPTARSTTTPRSRSTRRSP